MERKGETRIHNGITYYRYPDSRHRSLSNYFSRQGVYLHRIIYEQHHGPIPANHHIHHIDGNTTNNAIENLLCVPAEDHLTTYHPDITPDRIDFFNQYCRPKA